MALGSNALNVGLNYLFILGGAGFPALGLTGAALGTGLSQLAAVAVLTLLLARGAEPALQVRPRLARIDRALMSDLIRIGAPASADILILNAGFLSIVGMLGRLDPLAVAAHGMGLRVQALAFVPGMSISQAIGAWGPGPGGRRCTAGAHRVALRRRAVRHGQGPLRPPSSWAACPSSPCSTSTLRGPRSLRPGVDARSDGACPRSGFTSPLWVCSRAAVPRESSAHQRADDPPATDSPVVGAGLYLGHGYIWRVARAPPGLCGQSDPGRVLRGPRRLGEDWWSRVGSPGRSLVSSSSGSVDAYPLHLAIPVHDLTAARVFYGTLLGCAEGRSAERQVDFDLLGHQLSVHLADSGGIRATIPSTATPYPSPISA